MSQPKNSVLSGLKLAVATLLLGSSAFLAAQSPGTPGYVEAGPVNMNQVPSNLNLANVVLTMPADGSPSSAIFKTPNAGYPASSNNSASTKSGIAAVQGNIPGVNTLPTFTGEFNTQAGPSTGKNFFYSMIGNDPLVGGTTHIPAPIDEITLTLLNGDGSTFMSVPYTPFHALTLGSPDFANSNYKSSPGVPTQYTDAIMRASFFNTMNPSWHTVLDASVVSQTTITVPYFVNVRLSNGNIIQARSYFTGTASDGHTFVLMLDLLFNFFFDNEAVNQIVLGNFQAGGLNTLAFPNTFLFSLNVNNPNAPGGCCTLGFHSYFFDTGNVPQSRWVTEYASWISPGIFGGGFQDVTALSHEVAEAFGNPFLENAAPKWQFPGEPANSKVCQANLENGDPIEVLANPVSNVIVPPNLKPFHPQTIVLLPWFFMGQTSNAIDGAWSFPNETTLTKSAVPCPQ